MKPCLRVWKLRLLCNVPFMHWKKIFKFCIFASHSTAPSIIFITRYPHTKLFSGLWPFLICTNEENCACDSMEMAYTFFCTLLFPLFWSVSFCLFLSLSVFLCLSLSFSVFLCFSLSLCLSVSLSFCLTMFVSLSLCLSVFLSFCLSVSLSDYVCLPVSLSLSLSDYVCLPLPPFLPL